MSSSSPRTFTEDFRRFFLRGLVVLLPTILTLWLVVYAYLFVHDAIAEPINRGVRVAIAETSKHWTPLRDKFDPSEEALQKQFEELTAGPSAGLTEEQMRMRLRRENIATWWSDHWYMDLIGLVVAIIAVYLAGRLLGGFVGRRVYRRVESFITSVPVFKQVYPSVKQVVDFLFADEQPIKFNRVVVCEYPRKGVWAVGFLTGDSMRDIRRNSGDSVTVFIPSSPTPFTGYTITIPRNEVIEVPISVDEAIRFAVSGGVLVPPHQRIGGEVEELMAKAGAAPPAEGYEPESDNNGTQSSSTSPAEAADETTPSA